MKLSPSMFYTFIGQRYIPSEQSKLLFEQEVLFEWSNLWNPGASIILSLSCTNSGLQNLLSGTPLKWEEIHPGTIQLVSGVSVPWLWRIYQISKSPSAPSCSRLQCVIGALGSMAFCTIVWEEAIISDPNTYSQRRSRWGSLLHLPLSLTITRNLGQNIKRNYFNSQQIKEKSQN